MLLLLLKRMELYNQEKQSKKVTDQTTRSKSNPSKSVSEEFQAWGERREKWEATGQLSGFVTPFFFFISNDPKVLDFGSQILHNLFPVFLSTICILIRSLLPFAQQI